MKKQIVIISSLILMLLSCEPEGISDFVDHWEISRTFKTYCNSTLEIDTVENEYKVVEGHNQVLIVSIENKPVFKEGKELTDLYSIKSLLIELDTVDNTVSAQTPSKSKLYRKLVAFSPDHGISPLDKDQKIILVRKDTTVWSIESDIERFAFIGELNFVTNQTLTNKYNDY